MAIKVMEGLTAEWITPDSEKDKDKPSRFKLKPLDGEQQDEALEGSTYKEESDTLYLSPRGIRAALRHGIKDWENVEGDNGPIKCKHTNFNVLPWAIRQELAGWLVNHSNLSGEQEKNS